MTESTLTPVAEEHPFAPFIRILGKGKTGTRSLSVEEAHIAFGMILRGEADPLQLGAFLMLLRVKEETPDELAGFVQACRETMTTPPRTLGADLDWSCYAGKKHQHPWFILSMLLLAEAGYRVFVHGSSGHTPGRLYTEDAMRQLGLPVAKSWDEVAEQLEHDQLSYLPLEHFCQPLQALMQLRPLLGLRSPVNTLSRLINPLQAPASIQSVFHPAYARLHQEADRILQQPHALVFKGDSGEIEIKPQADTRITLLHQGVPSEVMMPRTIAQRVESVGTPSVQPLQALWSGNAVDDYGLYATLATAAAALLVINPELDLEAAQRQARHLWDHRNIMRLS